MATMFPLIKSSFDRLRDEIDTTFDRWLSRRGDPEGAEGGKTPSASPGEMLHLDLEEDEKEIRVTAEMPGLDKDDFTVELLGNNLVIRGEKKAGHEEKKRNYYFAECSYGSFSRTVPLPAEVDAAKTTATYKNGILTLTLPKSEHSRAKQINVKVA